MMTQDYKQEFMLDGACYSNCAYMGIVGATRPDSIALFPRRFYGLAAIAKNIGNSPGGVE